MRYRDLLIRVPLFPSVHPILFSLKLLFHERIREGGEENKTVKMMVMMVSLLILGCASMILKTNPKLEADKVYQSQHLFLSLSIPSNFDYILGRSQSPRQVTEGIKEETGRLQEKKREEREKREREKRRRGKRKEQQQFNCSLDPSRVLKSL